MKKRISTIIIWQHWSHAIYAISRVSAPLSTSHFPLVPRQIRMSFLPRHPTPELAFPRRVVLLFGLTLPLVWSGICCDPSASHVVFGFGIYNTPASGFRRHLAAHSLHQFGNSSMHPVVLVGSVVPFWFILGVVPIAGIKVRSKVTVSPWVIVRRLSSLAVNLSRCLNQISKGSK